MLTSQEAVELHQEAEVWVLALRGLAVPAGHMVSVKIDVGLLPWLVRLLSGRSMPATKELYVDLSRVDRHGSEPSLWRDPAPDHEVSGFLNLEVLGIECGAQAEEEQGGKDS